MECLFFFLKLFLKPEINGKNVFSGQHLAFLSKFYIQI